MRTYADGLAAIQTLAVPPANERLALAAAAGRVLAEDVRLSGDQPPFDRATMDGYAVRLQDGVSRYRVRGTVPAGVIHAGELAPGEALRIMTGAPCPPGTTVVPHEQTDRGSDEVTVTEARALAPGRNIARRGEDGRAGAVVAAAGATLTPLMLAAAAMAGVHEVAVSRRPRLAIVTTGDEVGAAGPAGIHDSNGPFLLGFAAALGLEATRTHAPDQGDALRQALDQAASNADVVVTSGGVSAGDRDLVPALAGELGFATVFHHLAMQPGKPVLLAQRGRQFLAGLPGNPVSVVATAHLVLLPLLARLLGAPVPHWLELPLAMPWTHRGNRQLFLPARLVAGGVAPIRWNGSGDLLAAAHGDGLVDLAPGADLATGALVRLLPYVGWRAGLAGQLPPRDPR
jgi:molybdopterin molybdotransferase